MDPSNASPVALAKKHWLTIEKWANVGKTKHEGLGKNRAH
jgi:hypothetical protein